MKNRCCIFVFYDFDDIIDDYVRYSLNAISKVVNKLWIVINSNTKDQNILELKKYTDKIVRRENRGYDAGAYKDVITSDSFDEIREYDELILMNDTFYGPFYPWKKVFDRMDETLCDFWGITCSYPDEEMQKRAIFKHIQSYFLVIDKKITNDNRFQSFFERMEYAKEQIDAMYDFEIALSQNMYNWGYEGKSYLDVLGEKIPKKMQGDYCGSSYELIAKFECPILKRKAIVPFWYENSKMALDYIHMSTSYPVNMIWANLKRLDMAGKLGPLGFEELEQFCINKTKIYILGSGKFGKGIRRYIEEIINREVAGYIVIDRKYMSDNTFLLSEINLNLSDGVVVAVGPITLKQIRPKIEKKICEKMILFPH